MTRRAVLIAAVVAMIAWPLGVAGPAHAGDEDLQVELLQGGVVSPLTGPLFSELNLSEDSTLVRRVRVSNQSDESATVTLGLSELRHFENGCGESEIEAGDTTCGPAEGEMLEAVAAVVTSSGVERYRGSLSGLDGLSVADDLASHSHIPVEITLAFGPASSGVVQSDSLTFDLRWTLDGETTDVLGSETEVDQPGSAGFGTSSGPQVPFAVAAGLGGGTAATLGTVGLGLALLGAVILAVVLRRKAQNGVSPGRGSPPGRR